jgi:hypothetical protein
MWGKYLGRSINYLPSPEYGYQNRFIRYVRCCALGIFPTYVIVVHRSFILVARDMTRCQSRLPVYLIWYFRNFNSRVH